MPSALRIRIAALEPSPEGERVDARTAFWRPLRSTNESEGQSIPQLEAKLRRKFGETLARHMLEGIRHALSEMDRAARGDEPPWRFFDFPMRREEPYYDEAVAAYSRYLDFRQQLISDNSAYSDAIRRPGDASSVLFSVTIRGYTSLNLDVDISPLHKLASAFESDFESFRVFLDVFVPKTIGDIFTPDFANSFSYNIDIPQEFKQAFLSVPQSVALPKATAIAPAPPEDTKGTDSQERAKWLWRLANGSLLVPVILALVVLYLGWQEMSSLRDTQQKALESALDHQQKLLEEDRQRLDALLNPKPSTSGATQGTTTSATPSPKTP
ncbi:MAG: hypothetical protein ACKO6N_03305 [Myxococcota bacterium]